MGRQTRYNLDDKRFRVCFWNDTSHEVTEEVVRANIWAAARAAYDAVLIARPHECVVLMDGARIVEQRNP